jgi:hypothetical protein
MKINYLSVVEAAGVEPAQALENTEVVDFRKGQKSKKGQKGESTVQTLYKNAPPRPPSPALGTTKYPPKMVPSQAHFLVCSLSGWKSPVRKADYSATCVASSANGDGCSALTSPDPDPSRGCLGRGPLLGSALSRPTRKSIRAESWNSLARYCTRSAFRHRRARLIRILSATSKIIANGLHCYPASQSGFAQRSSNRVWRWLGS